MALYAFDGTWNKDKPGSEHDTNVIWFRDAYPGAFAYQEGIGTKFGLLGKLAGGITGAGGRERISAMKQALKKNFAGGDTTIHIIGFSRGAALALHFANQIAKGKVTGVPASAEIAFLGIWDTVPSFGIPSIPANIGWDLDLPDTVRKCYHAMSLDERRIDFKLHRPDARVADANQEGRLFEVWFRGVHSDVGGGNDNPGLSSVALNWMFTKAALNGIDLKPDVVAANHDRMDPDAAISIHDVDPILKFRVVRWNDQVHESVAFRTDTGKRKHNNPPANLARVDDAGDVVGAFERG
ncbi:MAG: DUF2235 domain-containing protein [Vicinamibacterales bacterium]